MLSVYNSLSKKVEPFTPNRNIKWYTCGPTVYDSSHLGHARSYIGIDIAKRIIREYLGYDIFYVMNITDIDDKIIEKVKHKFEDEKDISSEKFISYARYYENEFLKDMEDLGVDPPDVIARVTDYIEEIKTYIQKIIDKKFAYISNGSVYFDTRSFCADNDGYKLHPNGGPKEETAQQCGEKRNAADFALWKASKPGEPSWTSQWGSGRPGWHIECSTIASEILGDSIDIHSGGEDLKFPHHNNELAQSEAYFGCKCAQRDWVKYFLHTGHLHINGQKMSKSLKNFITIKEILSSGQATARQLRLLFLSHQWNKPMTYDPQKSINMAKIKEKTISSFFSNIDMSIRRVDNSKWTNNDRKMNEILQIHQEDIKESLLDNFNTPKALESILNLISDFNKYASICEPQRYLMIKIRDYVSKILIKVFGLPSFDVKNVTEEKDRSAVIDILNDFRSSIRLEAKKFIRSPDKINLPHKILGICDKLRDEHLPKVGIKVEDSNSGSIWRYDE